MTTYEPQYMSNDTIELIDAIKKSNEALVDCLKHVLKLNHLGKSRDINDFVTAIIEKYERNAAV
jgi:hypothetical protein